MRTRRLLLPDKEFKIPDIFVYFHCRPNGTIFYVGKGTRARAYRLSNRNEHHTNIVSKYGKENIIVELTKCVDEAEAFYLEQVFIMSLREDGVVLSNKSDGGEGGMNGYKPSEETCRKHREFRHTEEAKEKMRLKAIGNKNGRGNRGKVRTDEQRIKNGEARRGKKFGPCSDETKRKIGDANRGRKLTPLSEEIKLKISNSLKAAYEVKRKNNEPWKKVSIGRRK